MKKVIVVILVILLTIAGGLVVPILLNRNTSNANTQPTKAPHTHNGKQNPIPSASGENIYSVTELSTPPQNTTTQEKLITPTATVTVETDDLPSASSPMTKGSEEWIERKIREHRNEILDEDLSDFRRIYSKVDIAYLQSFGSGGYSNEETEKAKKYLRDTLGADYERAKILFYRYSYILNEE
ncbi:MAG: hypothetical protein GX383_06390 [Clostridium sp.]|jgi:uncharacterized alpha/beta hydrolase family protein|nr:hypothetical protein [Clostridium sp.]